MLLQLFNMLPEIYANLKTSLCNLPASLSQALVAILVHLGGAEADPCRGSSLMRDPHPSHGQPENRREVENDLHKFEKRPICRQSGWSCGRRRCKGLYPSEAAARSRAGMCD